MEQVVGTMEEYSLTQDDYDTIMDISKFKVTLNVQICPTAFNREELFRLRPFCRARYIYLLYSLFISSFIYGWILIRSWIPSK